MNEGSVQFATDEGLKNIYTPASWSNKIKFIEHLITNNNVLLSILGKEGGGKTTFTQLLQTNLSSKINVHLLTISPLFNRNSLIADIASLLDRKDICTLQSLVEFVQSEKKHTLVILDDAHYLADEFLQELLHVLQPQGDKPYFHVCLSSNLSAIPKLNHLAQGQYKDMIHSIELAPLSEVEAKIYVMHRLLLQSNSFTNEHLEQFYQLTNGDIVGINSQMKAFFRLVKENKKSNTRRPLQQTMIAAGVGLAAWGVTFMLQPHGSTGALELTEYTTESSLQPQEIPLPKPVAEVDILVPMAQAKEQNDIVNNAVVATNRAMPTRSEDEERIQLDRASEMQAKIVEKMSQEIAYAQTEKQLDSSPAQSVSAVGSKPLVKAKSDKTSNHTYTIQLLASHSKKALEHFVHTHHLDGKAQIRLSHRNGMPWYVLTMGTYSQRDMAKKATYTLPKDVIQSKPWVRSLSDLKKLG